MKWLVFGSLFIGGAITVQAQNIYSSPYSVNGIGLIHERMSSLNRAMGGTGIGVQDEFNLNYMNPASLGGITSPISHIYETGFFVESNRYRTSTQSESKSTGGLNNLNAWFKISPRWNSTLGITPYSSMSYNITTAKEYGDLSEGTYRYDGSGNITQLYLGNAFNLIKNLSLGVNVSYLFGSISKNEAIVQSATADLMKLQNKIFTKKFNLDFGIQYKIPLNERSLVVGAVFDHGFSLSGRQKITLLDGGNDTLNSATGDRITYKLPPSAGVGLGLHSKQSIIALDVRYKKWTNAKFGEDDLIFADTWRYSVGYAYKGNQNAESYLGLIGLRAGFYAENYYLKLKGNTLPNWGFSAGISVPVFDNRSSINLTYSFDYLGTTRDQLIQQKSQKIALDIVMRDLWGYRRKFD